MFQQYENSIEQTKQLQLESQCFASGLRRTPLLKIVLAILIEANEYLTVKGIHKLTCRGERQYYFGSIHRIINKLVAAGLVERHQFETYQAYFMLKGAIPQDHLIDSDTGRIINFRNDTLDRAKEEILREYGFISEEGYVEIYARKRDDPTEPSGNSENNVYSHISLSSRDH